MEIEQYFEDDMIYHESDEEDVSYSAKWKSDDTSSGNFDCNICLEPVQDPVVTLCGHLFCWPCIYKWIYMQTSCTQEEEEDEDDDQTKHQHCPVCKAEVSRTSLVPIYGYGQTSKGRASSHHGMVLPRRPLGPVRVLDVPRSRGHPRLDQRLHLNYPQQSNNMSIPDPVTRVLCEMVSERLFGSSLINLPTHPNSEYMSPRVRRRALQADKSLSRIYLFLVCCVVLCLLLF